MSRAKAAELRQGKARKKAERATLMIPKPSKEQDGAVRVDAAEAYLLKYDLSRATKAITQNKSNTPCNHRTALEIRYVK